MYALVKTGGKQYRVAKDDTILVERIAAEESCYCGDSTQSFCFVTRRLSVDFVSRHLQATISILILSF